MIVRCAPQVGRVFARNASSASSSASIVQKTYTKPLSVANVKAEAECGIHCRMSENVTVGSAPALAYDEVHHEILNSGVECKLAFTPSYSDAHQHGTNGRKLHALQHSMLAAGEDVYLHFNLYTEGITTERAIQRISAALGMSSSTFYYDATLHLNPSFTPLHRRTPTRHQRGIPQGRPHCIHPTCLHTRLLLEAAVPSQRYVRAGEGLEGGRL